MSQQELLKKVIRALEAAEIDYMVTGSIVSSIQGEPRSTHDIDLVVAIRSADVKNFVKAFPQPQFYLDEDSIIEAIDQRRMFNLMDIDEGSKVDFWLLTDDAFDRSRFDRRYVEEVMGMKMYVSRPEDTILMKLSWAKLSGGSEKQFTDALRIFEVQHKKLDLQYLRVWAEKLEIEIMLQRLEKEAEII